MNKIIMIFIIFIFSIGLANANDRNHKIRVIPIENSDWNVIYNYSKCWTHYVYGKTKEEAIENYFNNNRSIGYNILECIIEGEDV